MNASPGTLTFWMVIVVAVGFLICSMGLKNGVERITKWMMLALLAIMVILGCPQHFPARSGGRTGVLSEAGRWKTAGGGSGQTPWWRL